MSGAHQFIFPMRVITAGSRASGQGGVHDHGEGQPEADLFDR